jgi:hypothetical protein
VFPSTNSGLTIRSMHPPATSVFAVSFDMNGLISLGVIRVKYLKGLLSGSGRTPINSIRNAGQSGSPLTATLR